MIDVILPAGGRIGGGFAAETGVEIKALLAALQLFPVRGFQK